MRHGFRSPWHTTTRSKTNSSRGCPTVFKHSIFSVRVTSDVPPGQAFPPDEKWFKYAMFPRRSNKKKRKKERKIAKKFRFIFARKKDRSMPRRFNWQVRSEQGWITSFCYCENTKMKTSKLIDVFARFEVRTTPSIVLSLRAILITGNVTVNPQTSSFRWIFNRWILYVRSFILPWIKLC